jgi:cytochrome c oxidase subunit II
MTPPPPTDTIWWGLERYYMFLGFAAGVIVITWMVHNVIVNRYKPGRIKTAPKYEKNEGEWGNWKGTMMIILVTSSVLAFVEYQTFMSTSLYTPPATKGDPINITVIGRQWDWIFVYPNGVQIEGNLTVPQNAVVILNITSQDVVHSFTIPALSVAKDAVPDRFNTLWLNATQLGSYRIYCKEFCGVGHALMTGTLVVVSQSAYNQWYSQLQAPSTGGVSGTNGTSTSSEVSTAANNTIATNSSILSSTQRGD